MIYYITKKTLNIISGGTMKELRDLCNKYPDYSFSISPKIEDIGIVAGEKYINVTSRIEHN